MRYLPISVGHHAKAYDIPSRKICKFCHLCSRKVSLKLKLAHRMAATMFGEVQVQQAILGCFTRLHKTKKGNNYLAIYIENTHNGQSTAHTKGLCWHRSTWYKLGLHKVKLKLQIISNHLICWPGVAISSHTPPTPQGLPLGTLPNKSHTVLDILCCMPHSKRERGSALWIYFSNAWGQLTDCSPWGFQEWNSRAKHGPSSINEVRVVYIAPLKKQQTNL